MSELTLWDTHVHLDFMRNPARVAQEAAASGLGLFANTVTPDGYEWLAHELTGLGNVLVGVGLHPWWVADGRCDERDVARVCELVGDARFVGEIGLDFSPRHVPDGSRDTQISAFEQVVRTCARTSDAANPKVLSIHGVRAAGTALDLLERTGALASCRCIFHWFSGTSDELHRAVRAGCWFSINEMMLRTKRGREYARQLPEDLLLLETDLPPGEDVPFEASEIVASLERTLAQLAAIRGKDLREVTCRNTRELLGTTSQDLT